MLLVTFLVFYKLKKVGRLSPTFLFFFGGKKMIIEMFIMFVCIAFILTIVGYYIQQELLIIFGFLIFGLISIPLFQQDLEIRGGMEVTTDYFYENTTLNNTFENQTYTYNNYEDTIWYGLFFMFISLSGMFFWYKGYSSQRGEDEN